MFLLQRKELLQKVKEDQLIELKNLIIRKSRHASLTAKIILIKVIKEIKRAFEEELAKKMLKFQKEMAKVRITLLVRRYFMNC